MPAILSIKDVTRKFGSITAVDHLSLDIEPGEPEQPAQRAPHHGIVVHHEDLARRNGVWNCHRVVRARDLILPVRRESSAAATFV